MEKFYLLSGTWSMGIWAESAEDALEYFENESDIEDFDIDTTDIKIEILE